MPQSFVGTYFIQPASYPRAFTALRGDRVVAAEGQKTPVSVEHAGQDLYRFHVLDQDLVWTLYNIGNEQLSVDGDQGLPSQRFKLVDVDGEGGTFYLSVETNDGNAYLGIAPYTIPIFPPIYFIVGYPEKEKAKAEKWIFSKLN